MTIISIFVFIFVLFALSRVILRAKDHSISFRENLFWIVVWLTIVFLTLFPQITDKLSAVMGIGRGIDTAFFLAIILLFYIVFRLYVKIDELDKRLTELTINSSKEIHKLKRHFKKPE
jgi:hypothetical protein